jgi:hypothetical protein
MKKHHYKRLAFAIALTAIAGLLWSAFALTRKKNRLSSSTAEVGYAAARSKGTSPAKPDQTGTTRSVTLSVARVSVDANNRLVVSMEACGDLLGELTLMIDRNSDNTIRGGDWALVVGHAEYSGTPDADGDQPGVKLVRRGTLWGSISGGTVLLNSDGGVASLDGLQLTLGSGSLEFDGATGSGSAQATDLQDTQTSRGSLILTF